MRLLWSKLAKRIVQGVFMPFLLADGDEADGVRTGGLGQLGNKSTAKQFENAKEVMGYR